MWWWAPATSPWRMGAADPAVNETTSLSFPSMYGASDVPPPGARDRSAAVFCWENALPKPPLPHCLYSSLIWPPRKCGQNVAQSKGDSVYEGRPAAAIFWSLSGFGWNSGRRCSHSVVGCNFGSMSLTLPRICRISSRPACVISDSDVVFGEASLERAVRSRWSSCPSFRTVSGCVEVR